MAFFNLNKSVLRTVTRLDNTYIYDVEVEKVKESANDALSTNFYYVLKGGYAATLLEELSNYLNFSYKLVMDLDSSTGLTYSFDKARNLSIDLFAASYSLSEDRALTVDPTFVTGASRVQVFINHRYESFMLELLLVPFQYNAWVCLLLLLGILIISSGFIAYFREKVCVQDAIFQMISACFQQASFSAIIIHACFSGKIVSIAAIRRYSMDTLDEVVSSKFDIGFDVGQKNGSVLERIAKTLQKRPVMSKLLKKVRASNFRFENFQHSMREVEKRPFAYIIDEETGLATIERTLGHFPCDWGSISFAGVKYPWSMFMKKGSQFRPAINYGILKLRETGNLRRLNQRWIRMPGTRCSGQRGDCVAKFTSIKLRNLQAAFVLLSSSIFIALFILVIENLKRKKFHVTLRSALK